MAAGNLQTDSIVQAIALAEAGTTGEIRVHLSRRLIEKNPRKRAAQLFDRFGMSRTRQRNAVLLYVNLRRRRFAILGDQAVDQTLGQAYWQEISRQLTDHLRSTDPERAIALTVASIGEKLRLHFPEDSR